MRIIESEEETTFPEKPVSEEKEIREVIEEKPKAKSLPQKEIILIAKEIHELGNKLIELATKL